MNNIGSNGHIIETLTDNNGSSITTLNGYLIRRTRHGLSWTDNMLHPRYTFCCWNCEPTKDFDILIKRPDRSMAMKCKKCGFVDYYVR